MTLGLETARAIAAAARAAAAEDGRSITVAVVDERGHDVLVERMDATSWFTAGVARAKAATAVAMGRPTADLAGLRTAYPELVPLIADQLAHPFTTLPGGVPLVVDGAVVGAVAVSGGTPEQDAAYASAGAESVARH